MEKRVTSRGIIIEGEFVYLMHRRKKQDDGSIREYYVIPGGTVESGEDILKTLYREIYEEYMVEVDNLGYLGELENKDAKAYFYKCKIVSGNPTLGGPEKEANNEDNSYEIVKIPINDLDNYDVAAKDFILKAYNNEFIENKNA